MAKKLIRKFCSTEVQCTHSVGHFSGESWLHTVFSLLLRGACALFLWFSLSLKQAPSPWVSGVILFSVLVILPSSSCIFTLHLEIAFYHFFLFLSFRCSMFRTSVPNGDSVCCSFFYILRLLFHWKERRGRNKWITCYSLHSNYSPSLDVQHKGHFLVTLSSNFLDVIQGENSEEGIDSPICAQGVHISLLINMLPMSNNP